MDINFYIVSQITIIPSLLEIMKRGQGPIVSTDEIKIQISLALYIRFVETMKTCKLALKLSPLMLLYNSGEAIVTMV